jgi:hypothetical protein
MRGVLVLTLAALAIRVAVVSEADGLRAHGLGADGESFR